MISESVLEPLVRRWSKFTELREVDRKAILALPYRLKEVGRDQHLVREGQEPQNCCLILSGFAFRHKVTRDGARQIISIHLPGEFIDLQNSLLGVADHNVQTLTRAEVALVPRTELQDMMEKHRGAARAMWIDTLIDSSIFREWVVNVGRRDAQTRVAHLLCELMLRMEAAGLTREHGYELPLTQAQLADATGLTPVHVNRVLKGLREKGLISLEARSLRILDLEGLQDVGDFSELYLHHQVQPPQSRPVTA
ncbi:MAG TPA: Crp/Fnr family transcriptional regulator [Allosphingosinicella sp.]|nr:Crp/Fnr family transcriptional regulator [Allosphingosinicella sp.]